jgi:hypothetical protein
MRRRRSPRSRERSPDREYYLATKDRIGGNRACLSVARKLLKRSYHRLRELGEGGCDGGGDWIMDAPGVSSALRLP